MLYGHSKSHEDLELITECARCSKALLNTKPTLEGVLTTNGAIDTIIASTSFVSDKTKSMVLEVLAALCLVSPDTHGAICKALEPSLGDLIAQLTNDESAMSLKVHP